MYMSLDHKCCEFSMMCYNNEHIIKNEFNKKHVIYKEPTFLHSDLDAQCFTTSRRNEMYITFRGTDSILDVLTDLNVLKVSMDLYGIPDENRPKVHYGFLKQFRSIQNELDELVEEFMLSNYKVKDIIITGHSLGGGLATLASLHYGLKYKGISVFCVSFGSPRVGNKKFAKMFNKNVYMSRRYVNDDDPITMIPSSIRFTHVNGLRYICKNGIISNINFNRIYKLLKNMIKSILGKEKVIGDHSCEEYYIKLKKCDL